MSDKIRREKVLADGSVWTWDEPVNLEKLSVKECLQLSSFLSHPNSDLLAQIALLLEGEVKDLSKWTKEFQTLKIIYTHNKSRMRFTYRLESQGFYIDTILVPTYPFCKLFQTLQNSFGVHARKEEEKKVRSSILKILLSLKGEEPQI